MGVVIQPLFYSYRHKRSNIEENVVQQAVAISPLANNQEENLTNQAVATGLMLTGVLVVDDATVIGAVDDVAIPLIWTVVGVAALYDEFSKIGNKPTYSLDASNSKKKKVSSAESKYNEESEHTSNKNPSNRNKHEKGRSRNNRDKGKEKGDSRRTRYK